MSEDKKTLSGNTSIDKITKKFDINLLLKTDGYKVSHNNKQYFDNHPINVESDKPKVITIGLGNSGAIAAVEEAIKHGFFLFNKEKAEVITESGKIILREMMEKPPIIGNNLIKKDNTDGL
jgi:hypothetical protein